MQFITHQLTIRAVKRQIHSLDQHHQNSIYRHVVRRLNCVDLDIVVSAYLVQKDVGGNLTEVTEKVGEETFNLVIPDYSGTAEIVRLETQLNAQVYDLFDLTTAEVKLIEESTKYRHGEV